MIAAMFLEALVGAFSGRFVVPCDEGALVCDDWKRKTPPRRAPAAFGIPLQERRRLLLLAGRLLRSGLFARSLRRRFFLRSHVYLPRTLG
jgi:hypothetical protein